MRNPRTLGALLWTLQALLALFFALGSGAPKLLIPLESLPMPIPLPAALVWFIGTCEVLGGLALILPGLLRIRTGLTPLAAAALVALTALRDRLPARGRPARERMFAVVIGLLAAFVAYGAGGCSRSAGRRNQPRRGRHPIPSHARARRRHPPASRSRPRSWPGSGRTSGPRSGSRSTATLTAARWR